MAKNDLTWSTGLDNAALIRGFAEAQKHAEKAAAQIKAVMVTAAVAIGFAFTGKEIFSMVEKALKAGKALDSLSRSSGFAASEIKFMEIALDRSGGSAEEVTGIMTDMRDRITDAARQGGDLNRTFSAWGLNLQALQGMKAADQFREIAGAVNSIVDPYVRAKVAAELLGGAGAAAAANLRADDFDRAGKVMSAGASAIAIAAPALARASDSWERVKSTGQAVFDTIAAEMAPAFELVARMMEDILPKAISASKTIGIYLSDAFKAIVGMFKDNTIGEALKIGFEISIRYLANLLTQTVRFTGALLGQLISDAWDNAKGIDWEALWSGFASLGQFITGVLLKAFATPVSWLQDRIQWIFEKLMKTGRTFEDIQKQNAAQGGPTVMTAQGIMTADQLMGKGAPGARGGKKGGVDIGGLWAGSATDAFTDPSLQDKMKKLIAGGKLAFSKIPVPSESDKAPGKQGIGRTGPLSPIMNVFDSFRKVGGGIGGAAASIPAQQLDIAKQSLSVQTRMVELMGGGGKSQPVMNSMVGVYP